MKVEAFDASLHTLLDEMAKAMYFEEGIGLAAPQVGEFKRIFIVDIGEAEGNIPQLKEFINPVLSNGEGKIKFEEGCLSVPGLSELVDRKAKIQVHYQDRYGRPQRLQAEDLLAVAIQHENDHLEGILFIDRLSPLKRRLARKKAEKLVTL